MSLSVKFRFTDAVAHHSLAALEEGDSCHGSWLFTVTECYIRFYTDNIFARPKKETMGDSCHWAWVFCVTECYILYNWHSPGTNPVTDHCCASLPSQIRVVGDTYPGAWVSSVTDCDISFTQQKLSNIIFFLFRRHFRKVIYTNDDNSFWLKNTLKMA